ncbi:class I SAM-dependent methyltransferase, partial [Escherichia coli]|nr:class I SAM-dependent methyltransferase [Escherichia coli]
TQGHYGKSGDPGGPRIVQKNAGQIEYVGLEQSQEMLLSARQRLAPWPGARLSLWNADTLAAPAHSADIIWLNNALHRLLPEDP